MHPDPRGYYSLIPPHPPANLVDGYMCRYPFGPWNVSYYSGRKSKDQGEWIIKVTMLSSSPMPSPFSALEMGPTCMLLGGINVKVRNLAFVISAVNSSSHAG